jgi:phage replication-related protein YjqB (UPF0714/DUF867 family)
MTGHWQTAGMTMSLICSSNPKLRGLKQHNNVNKEKEDDNAKN